MLPRYLARDSADLIELLPETEGPSADVWVLTHKDLKHLARIRAVTDFLVAATREALR